MYKGSPSISIDRVRARARAWAWARARVRVQGQGQGIHQGFRWSDFNPNPNLNPERAGVPMHALRFRQHVVVVSGCWNRLAAASRTQLLQRRIAHLITLRPAFGCSFRTRGTVTVHIWLTCSTPSARRGNFPATVNLLTAALVHCS
jgi:hypothetical protein